MDVNVLLAYGWVDHPFHLRCSTWIDHTQSFVTCPTVELGFLRISMTSVFNADFYDAQAVLKSIVSKDAATRIPCDLSVDQIPEVTSYKDTTDAYLVALAKKHGLKLATFDERLLGKKWARESTVNPF